MTLVISRLFANDRLIYSRRVRCLVFDSLRHCSLAKKLLLIVIFLFVLCQIVWKVLTCCSYRDRLRLRDSLSLFQWQFWLFIVERISQITIIIILLRLLANLIGGWNRAKLLLLLLLILLENSIEVAHSRPLLYNVHVYSCRSKPHDRLLHYQCLFFLVRLRLRLSRSTTWHSWVVLLSSCCSYSSS